MNTVNDIVALARTRQRLGEQVAVLQAAIFMLAADLGPKDGDRLVARITRDLPDGWVEAKAMLAYVTQPA